MTSYSSTYDPERDFDRWHTIATSEAVNAWIRPGDEVLELGCATGMMTEALVGAGAHVVAVDRAADYLARLAAKHLAGVELIEADVERFSDQRRFDHVIATNLVHELSDPEAFVSRCRDQLRPAGLLHVSLQNPQSIHRLVGMEMGLIASADEISDRGKAYDTLRLFDRHGLEQLGVGAGLRCVHHQGVLLKPLPNDRMAELPDDMIAGFLRAARHFPDHCSVNYLVFRR